MADNRAFVENILPEGSGTGEEGSVHQSSPSWVLTFIRWENRDTKRITDVPFNEVRDPLVVENDCVQVSVSVSKGSLTPQMSAILVMTDINYRAAVAPGDFVTVNMLNWEKDSRRVAQAAREKKQINGANDGFKGIFKVQGVRRVVTVDPATGTKVVLFKINGFAFTEFNNTIYFNPYLIDPNQDPKNQLLFASYIGRNWTGFINSKGLTNVENMITFLIQSFIGDGVTSQGRKEKNGTVKSPNVHFFIPELVGKLLGVTGAKAAKDVYNYLFGVQNYSGGSTQSLATGMNPSGLTQKFNRFYYTPTRCGGDTFLKPEFWNQVKAWAILNQYTNAPLNEMYTCFRISPEGSVMPTLVFRQIPFTTDDFEGTSIPTTKFTNLPRWRIYPDMVTGEDLGRDESARINFVQYFGRSTVGVEGADIAEEIARINYTYDVADVQRSGLRPYVVTTQFDEPTSTNKYFRSPAWAKVVGDALIGGHLKFNGTLECVGLTHPIAVGDNLEYDNVIYHIESISHNCIITGEKGIRQFRTSISLSSGVSVDSSAQGTRYAEMTYTDAYELRADDYNRSGILPGVSESQDVVYRKIDEDSLDSKPFPQPGPPVKKIKRK